jgi:membrane-associated phospholipid phosphatase
MKSNKRDLRLCIFLIVFLLGLQAFLYFATKNFNSSFHLIGSSLDYKIPFIKYFIYFYNSWYPFLVFVWVLIFYFDRDKCINFLVAGFLSIIIGNFIFLIYPTIVLRPDVVVNDFASLVVSITYKVDVPVNCMPSMHCIFCFIPIFCLINSKIKNRYKVPICLYFVLIIFSTLFVKQHVIIDVISAFIISGCCYLVSKLKFFDRFKSYLY